MSRCGAPGRNGTVNIPMCGKTRTAFQGSDDFPDRKPGDRVPGILFTDAEGCGACLIMPTRSAPMPTGSGFFCRLTGISRR